MLTIKEVSRLMCISPYTLRYYDKEGLFPFVKRNERNIRIFTEDDLEWVYIVQCLRETGLSIAKIRQYIIMCVEGDKTIPDRLKMLEIQKNNILLQLSETKEMLDMVDYKITSYRNRLNNKTDRIFNPFEKKMAENKEKNGLDKI